MARRIQIYPYPLSPSPYASRSKFTRLLIASASRRRHLVLPFVLCTILLYYSCRHYYLSGQSYHLLRLALPSLSLALSLDYPLTAHNETHVELPNPFPLRASDDPRFEFNPRRPCNQLTLSLSLPPLANFTPSSFSADDIVSWFSPSPPLAVSATLEERIAAFLESPLSTDPVHVEFNAQTCSSPSIDHNTNRLHWRENVEFWRNLKSSRVKGIRQEIVDILRTAQGEGRLDSRGPATRGLVWTAGNADTFDRVLVSLRLLRNQYNCHLPAEVFHFPSESPNDAQRAEFDTLNAKVISLASLDKEASSGRTKSFHIKGSAFTASSFTELLYLDSDSIPTRSPEFLFDSREFKDFGAVFWGDYWKDTKENAIWRILGVQCRDEWTMESGQVVIDKSRHLDALILLEYWLKDWRFWFRFSDGDKDLLRYAFLLLRKRWSVPSHTLASASWANPDELGEGNRDKFAGHTMVQFGLSSEFEDGKGGRERGRPLFVHGNLLKRIGGSFTGNGATWSRNLQLHLPGLERLFSIDQNATSPAPANTTRIEFERTLSADDFVNVSPYTGIGIAGSYSDQPSVTSADPRARDGPEVRSLEAVSTRTRAILSRGLRTDFWDGHRGWQYVLGIQLSWRDELADLIAPAQRGSGQEDTDSTFARWLKQEEEATCAQTRSIRDDVLESIRRSQDTPSVRSGQDGEEKEAKHPEGERGFLEIVTWSDFDELRDFEKNFYDAGGKANGIGF